MRLAKLTLVMKLLVHRMIVNRLSRPSRRLLLLRRSLLLLGLGLARVNPTETRASQRLERTRLALGRRGRTHTAVLDRTSLHLGGPLGFEVL